VAADKSRLKTMAFRNVGTKNPGIRLLVIQIMSPFITIRNKPNVRIVTGIVRIIRIGFRIRFRTERISATHNAEVKDATSTPGINHAIPITASAINKNFVIRRMLYGIFITQKYINFLYKKILTNGDKNQM
jgi:hypothetical protein